MRSVCAFSLASSCVSIVSAPGGGVAGSTLTGTPGVFGAISTVPPVIVAVFGTVRVSATSDTRPDEADPVVMSEPRASVRALPPVTCRKTLLAETLVAVSALLSTSAKSPPVTANSGSLAIWLPVPNRPTSPATSTLRSVVA
jgi:hypothetical protein